MKNISFDRLLNIVLILVVAFVLIYPRQSAAPVVERGDVQLASLNARTTVQLNPGDYVNCPTRWIPMDWQNARCAPLRETRTPAPSATNSLTPTVTSEVTVTMTATEHPHEATMTPSETPVGMGKCTDAKEHWHVPGAHEGYNAHEHGQAPKQWVIDFGRNYLGEEYPCFGGPESTGAMENQEKHVGYKCFSFVMNGVEFYACFHFTTNPLDRSFPFHSYRLYAKDQAGNISYRAGHIWYGYPEFISQRACRFEDAGRDQFIIEGVCPEDWAKFQRDEQWYGLGAGIEVSLTRGGASTFFSHDEYLMPMDELMNPENWNRTGALGLDYFRLELTVHTRGSGNIPNIPLDRVYCVSKVPIEDRVEGLRHRPKWTVIVPAVSSFENCPVGYLPQYTASTFPGVNFRSPGGNARVWEDEDIPGEGIVEFPN